MPSPVARATTRYRARVAEEVIGRTIVRLGPFGDGGCEGKSVRGVGAPTAGLKSRLTRRLHELGVTPSRMAAHLHSRQRLVHRHHLAVVPDLAGTPVDKAEIEVLTPECP